MANNNNLEERVWNSRLEYAVETFMRVNRDYWNIWTELTNSKKMHERLLGWVDKAIWLPFSATAALVIIPRYMTEVKYSLERQGYILKDTRQSSMR